MLRRERRTKAVAIDGRREAGFIARHSRESVALLIGAGALIWIISNALFMQTGPHPAPLFSTRKGAAIVAPPPAAVPAAVAARQTPAATPVSLVPVPAAAPTRSDPIATLIGPSKQLMAVQRALSEFGYGQIRPDGLYGPETKDAIMRFERAHKLPPTGQVSERLMKALAGMTGEPLR
ncbi:MAG: peptidoglycan-binding domain-containing protein [Pseudolabrys sp.]